MPSAVLDSTVLVSAFLTPSGLAGELLGLAGASYDLCLAPEIIAETRGVLLARARLRKGAGYTEERAELYCRGLERLTGANMVRDLPPLTGIVRDPNDDVIVAAAVKAGADYLVTRDKDLLALGSYQGICMITPEAFRGLLRGT